MWINIFFLFLLLNDFAELKNYCLQAVTYSVIKIPSVHVNDVTGSNVNRCNIDKCQNKLASISENNSILMLIIIVLLQLLTFAIYVVKFESFYSASTLFSIICVINCIFFCNKNLKILSFFYFYQLT